MYIYFKGKTSQMHSALSKSCTIDLSYPAGKAKNHLTFPGYLKHQCLKSCFPEAIFFPGGDFLPPKLTVFSNNDIFRGE